MRADLIELSFELAAERCPDLTPRVYERLFAEQPQMAALFCMDTDLQARGEMLSQAIRAILDFIDQRVFSTTLIASEAVTHAGYGVSPAVYASFFRLIAETLSELLGADWSAPMAAAWRELLDELAALVSPAAATATP